jgi:hypothetical protein
MSAKLKKEAALVIGLLVSILQALLALIGAGGLDDGFQFNPDGYLILAPILGALGIRSQVWSQDSVDALAPREVQERVKRDRR